MPTKLLLAAAVTLAVVISAAVTAGSHQGGSPPPRHDADNLRFTFAVVPDTQYLFDEYRGDSEPVTDAFDWIVANRASENVAFVAGLGDVTQDGTAAEVARADQAYRVLDRGGVPYSSPAGNHDINSSTNDQRGDSPFLQAFGPQRYRRDPTFTGTSPDGYNSYDVFYDPPAATGSCSRSTGGCPTPASPGRNRCSTRTRARRRSSPRTKWQISADSGSAQLSGVPWLGQSFPPYHPPQRPDLPHGQRPLLAGRQDHPEERLRPPRGAQPGRLPGPVLRRRGHDPHLRVRPRQRPDAGHALRRRRARRDRPAPARRAVQAQPALHGLQEPRDVPHHRPERAAEHDDVQARLHDRGHGQAARGLLQREPVDGPDGPDGHRPRRRQDAQRSRRGRRGVQRADRRPRAAAERVRTSREALELPWTGQRIELGSRPYRAGDDVELALPEPLDGNADGARVELGSTGRRGCCT